MRSILKRVSVGRRGRRVPKRNRTFLRLEELETRTVLATSLAGLGAPGLGSIQNAVPLLRLVMHNAVPGQAASPPGQGNAPGAANSGSSQSGGTNSTPLP